MCDAHTGRFEKHCLLGTTLSRPELEPSPDDRAEIELVVLWYCVDVCLAVVDLWLPCTAEMEALGLFQNLFHQSQVI